MALSKSYHDQDLLVLGIETSCDDTGASVVRRNADGTCAVLSNEVWDQHDRHRAYGGVVPEIAARSHVERVDLIIDKAMRAADVGYGDLDAIAATAGPGLVGGVMVGLTAGKALSMAHAKPLIPVNHLEGHALSVRITEAAPFPYLLLLISGGHTQLIHVRGLGSYERLGSTIDDAAGEAFDKTAKLLGLGQPGGPAVEAAATGGDPSRYDFPRPLLKRAGCDFSLSGLKTAVRLAAEAEPSPDAGTTADLAAAFQAAIADHLARRTARAMAALEGFSPEPALVVAGGVAANGAIRKALSALCQTQGWKMIVPPVKYCTDNGAMIAFAGAERLAAGLAPSLEESLALAPRARWPLAAPPRGREFGGGKKGPKA
ncbi:MAG: tRNA (adenosine(37)-N6)-threonylcarbamoyltransferase complex transferase subunit TsaD [Pseudomonadota bacterium]